MALLFTVDTGSNADFGSKAVFPSWATAWASGPDLRTRGQLHVLVDGCNRGAEVNAWQQDVVAGAKRPQQPHAVGAAAVDVDRLPPRAHQHVVLQRGAAAVQVKLVRAVVVLRGAREHFHHQARVVDLVLLAVDTITLITAHRHIGVDVAR